jgi:hypothetical protein
VTTWVDTPPAAERQHRPVRRFVVMGVVLAVLAGLTWWSGLANPRLSLTTLAGSYDGTTGIGTVTASLRNDAPAPIEIVDAHLESPGLDDVVLASDRDPLAGSTLDGGDAITVSLTYRSDPCGWVFTPVQAQLVVTVHTVTGQDRSRRLPLAQLLTKAVCP